MTALLLALSIHGASAAAGKGKDKPKPQATKNGKSKPAAGKPAAGKPAAAKSQPQPKEPALPPPQGKVAVFNFEGDGAAAVQRHVIATLKARGMKVATGLRPVDTAEQFREMSVTLNLVAYVDGEASADGDQGSATVFLRSGITGLRVASTTFAGDRRTLAVEVGKGLWERLLPELTQVCADAAKPRKAERPPLRIEAGTPIENTPADGDGRM